MNALTATIFLGLPRVYIYTRVEESLCNRLFIGHYKSMAYLAVSITLPKDVIVVLYSFQFGIFYSQ